MAFWILHSLALNNSMVLPATGDSSRNDADQIIYNTVVRGLMLLEYWLSVLRMDSLGPKLIEIACLAILTPIFLFIGSGYNSS